MEIVKSRAQKKEEKILKKKQINQFLFVPFKHEQEIRAVKKSVGWALTLAVVLNAGPTVVDYTNQLVNRIEIALRPPIKEATQAWIPTPPNPIEEIIGEVENSKTNDDSPYFAITLNQDAISAATDLKETCNEQFFTYTDMPTPVNITPKVALIENDILRLYGTFENKTFKMEFDISQQTELALRLENEKDITFADYINMFSLLCEEPIYDLPEITNAHQIEGCNFSHASEVQLVDNFGTMEYQFSLLLQDKKNITTIQVSIEKEKAEQLAGFSLDDINSLVEIFAVPENRYSFETNINNKEVNAITKILNSTSLNNQAQDEQSAEY